MWGKKDRRTYQERKRYQYEYQKKWRASAKGRAGNRKIYLKRRVAKSEQRQRRNAKNKVQAFKSFGELFSYHDPVSMVLADYVKDPTFRFSVKGKKTTEWLSEPLPTWVDENGVKCGGQKWNGVDFEYGTAAGRES